MANLQFINHYYFAFAVGNKNVQNEYRAKVSRYYYMQITTDNLTDLLDLVLGAKNL